MTTIETRDDLMQLVASLVNRPPHRYNEYEILCIVDDRLAAAQRRQDSQEAIAHLGRARRLPGLPDVHQDAAERTNCPSVEI